jgi:hypothetical protein
MGFWKPRVLPSLGWTDENSALRMSRGAEVLPVQPVEATFAEQRVRSIQASYRRALSTWAADLLTLRREGTLLTQWVKPRCDPDFDSDRRVA